MGNQTTQEGDLTLILTNNICSLELYELIPVDDFKENETVSLGKIEKGLAMMAALWLLLTKITVADLKKAVDNSWVHKQN